MTLYPMTLKTNLYYPMTLFDPLRPKGSQH